MPPPTITESYMVGMFEGEASVGAAGEAVAKTVSDRPPDIRSTANGRDREEVRIRWLLGSKIWVFKVQLMRPKFLEEKRPSKKAALCDETFRADMLELGTDIIYNA